MITVFDDLSDVAEHIIQAEFVRQKAADRCGMKKAIAAGQIIFSAEIGLTADATY
jgi:hypothetical protein